MTHFEQFLEAKGEESGKVQAVVDLVDAIRKSFAKMTLLRRKAAWKTVISKDGQKEIDIFIKNPGRNLSRIPRLASSN